MNDSKIIYTDHDGETAPDKKSKNPINRGAFFITFCLILALVMGALGGFGGSILLTTNDTLRKDLGLKDLNINTTKTDKVIFEESSGITDSASKVSPSVVSISTSTNVVDLFGQSYEAKGGGTGFIITNDGMIVTNKHVVDDDKATYTVFTSDGKDYAAKIIAKDPYNDLAVIKIDATGLSTVDLGDSDNLQIGQWVVAIGNALGEFSNSVTVGVVSAKERQITASGSVGLTESLEGLIQTDAAINPGNSGGPLVNLKGQVIGINTAVAGNAQGIGFAIPINTVKKAIDSIEKSGKIIRPMIGVRYVPITKEIAKVNKLSVDHGIWILRGATRSDVAVVPGSPADKAGIVENDIILSINGDDINEKQSLIKLLQKYNVGDEVQLKVLRKGKEMTIKVTLAPME
jgi:serine protease Do